MTEEERQEHEATIQRYRKAVSSATPIPFAALGAMDDAAQAAQKALDSAVVKPRHKEELCERMASWIEGAVEALREESYHNTADDGDTLFTEFVALYGRTPKLE